MIRLKKIWSSEKKLSIYIHELKPNKILLPFGHGLGDLVMFINPFITLSEKYPDIEFTLALQKGLGFDDLHEDIVGKNRHVIYSSDLSYNEDNYEYDIIADIDFPMNEGQIELTKGEWCCVHELGIVPVSGHKKLTCGKNRLVGLHLQITCLPDSANTPPEVAEKIWNEIKNVGYIPMETLLPHVFHNPVNERYSFVDRHLRDIHAKVSTLTGIIQNCSYFICCVSGNFHVALSVLPPERICLLEKDFQAGSFTKLPIKRINVMDYKDGEIEKWIQESI